MAERSPLAVGQVISHYRIFSLLGAGGMGEVYLAQDLRLDRKIALKVLPPECASNQERMQRFLREAKVTSSLMHPSIAHIYEIDEFKGIHFIAMEYVEGETLARTISARPMGLTEILEIGIQLADALQEAHGKGIVHRDIKPSNVMLTPKGQVKILDFGLAKMLREACSGGSGEFSTLTGTPAGTLMGTVEYMSPEQILGKEVDHRTDLFSLGAILYEMTTGRLPFLGGNRNETMDRILHTQPEAVARFNYSVPPEWERIVRKCLEKDRERRYQLAKELWIDLKNLQQERELSQIASLHGYRFIYPVELTGPEHTQAAPMPLATSTPAVPEPAPVKAAPGSFQKRVLRLPLWSWILMAGLLLVLIPRVQDWLTNLTGPSLPRKKSLVVLPFKNVGEDERNKPFCDGLLETITAKLTQLQQFQKAFWVVLSREVIDQGITSPGKAKGAFGVNLALTGSVQRDPDSIRVTLILVELETFRQLRSQVKDYPLTNLQTLEDSVTSELAEMLELKVTPKAEQLWAAERTPIPKAYEHYVEARGYLQQFQKVENVDQAIYAFQEALKEDPNYALAYAGLGEACWHKYSREYGDASWIDKAKTNSLMALKLNDQLAPVHVTRGLILKETGDYEAARAEFQRALELDPMSDAALKGLATAYEATGDLTQAEETYRKAINLKPDYWAGYLQLGSFFYLHQRYVEAIAQFERVIALTPDNPKGYNNLGAVYLQSERWGTAKKMFERSLQCGVNYGACTNLGSILLFEGKWAEAAEQYEAALKLNDGNYAVWGNLGSAYHWAGNEPQAREVYQKAIQKGVSRLKVNPSDADVLADLAVYHAMLGDRAQALSLMEKARIANPKDASIMYRAGLNYEHWGERDLALQWVGKALKNGYSMSTIKRSPELKKLREDPRFPQLVAEIGNKG